MLYIGCENEPEAVRWHVGETRPEIPANWITDISADGDELEYILSRFRNIPLASSSRITVSWFGDHAKFIFANLT